MGGVSALTAELFAPVSQWLWCGDDVMTVERLISVSIEGFYRHLFVNIYINIYKTIYVYEYIWGVCIYVQLYARMGLCVCVQVW